VISWCVGIRPHAPVPHIECSALRSIAVNDIFAEVAAMIYQHKYSQNTANTNGSDTEDDEAEFAYIDDVDGERLSDEDVPLPILNRSRRDSYKSNNSEGTRGVSNAGGRGSQVQSPFRRAQQRADQRFAEAEVMRTPLITGRQDASCLTNIPGAGNCSIS
jgi:hypothetical protein